MIRIVSDTSTMYSARQAQEAGFAVSALTVSIDGKSYREYDEIDSQQFMQLLQGGSIPTSSQPAVGEVAALYEQYPDDEILNITMAQGLSGTYDSAVTAAKLCDHGDRIHVFNSRTLCGPHRHLVEKAVQWVKEGASVREILERLEQKAQTAKSYLVPVDFEYLRRGGRLSHLVAHVGQVARLMPIMTQTEDGKRITVSGIRRGFSNVYQYIGGALKKRGVGEGWKVYISHAACGQTAEKVRDILTEFVPGAEFEIHPLSPAFIIHGGPGCVAVQVIEA